MPHVGVPTSKRARQRTLSAPVKRKRQQSSAGEISAVVTRRGAAGAGGKITPDRRGVIFRAYHGCFLPFCINRLTTAGADAFGEHPRRAANKSTSGARARTHDQSRQIVPE